MTKKRLVVVIVLGLSLLMAVVLAITLLNGEKWKALAVDTISENITTELVISDVEINIFSEFPRISIELLDVEIEGLDNSNAGDTKSLLSAEKLSVSFSIWEVLLRDPVIEDFSITGGDLFIEELPGGKWNYEITPEKPEDSAPLEISSIKLYGIDVELRSKLANIQSIINTATYKDGAVTASFEDLITGNDGLNPLNGTLETVVAVDSINNISVDVSQAVVNGIPLSASINIGSGGNWKVTGRSSNVTQDNVEAILNDTQLFEGISLGGSSAASLKVVRKD